jgi:hypothetical protein
MGRSPARTGSLSQLLYITPLSTYPDRAAEGSSSSYLSAASYAHYLYVSYIYDFFTHLPARRRTAGLAIRGCRGIPALSGEAPNSLAINGSASARPRCDSTTSASGNRNRKCYGTVEGYDRDVLKFWQAWFATIAVTLLTSAVIAFDLIDDTFRGWWSARAFATDTLQESWSSSLLC